MLPGSLLPYYRALQVLQGMEGRLGSRVTAGWDLLPGPSPVGSSSPGPQASVFCSDGAGRTGTYILVDMVLNRMAKGRCREAPFLPCP